MPVKKASDTEAFFIPFSPRRSGGTQYSQSIRCRFTRFVTPLTHGVFTSRSNMFEGCADKTSMLSRRPSGVTSNFTRTRPSIRNAQARCGYCGWLRLNARGLLARLASVLLPLACCHYGTRWRAATGCVVRVSTGRSSRLGRSSTFFTGFGFGLGLGFGSGLWITTGASFGGSGTTSGSGSGSATGCGGGVTTAGLKLRWRYHGHRNRLRGRWHFNNLMNRGVEQTRHNSTVNNDRKQRRPGKRRGKSRVIEVIIIRVKNQTLILNANSNHIQ
jgi:hypothetical protein